jgi:hypothetical protein
MIRSEKKLKQLNLILAKESPSEVMKAIRDLRSDQPFDGAIALLISYYDKSKNTSIRKLISEFMNDIKEQSASREIVEEIKKDILTDTKRMLISSCWQSGLDYSAFTDVFAGIFISTEDYMTALECFSVIEQSVSRMAKKDKQDILMMISDETLVLLNDKSALRKELVSILQE